MYLDPLTGPIDISSYRLAVVDVQLPVAADLRLTSLLRRHPEPVVAGLVLVHARELDDGGNVRRHRPHQRLRADPALRKRRQCRLRASRKPVTAVYHAS